MTVTTQTAAVTMGPPHKDSGGYQSSNRGARGGFSTGRGGVQYNVECFNCHKLGHFSKE